jgi:hypothetical protein
MKNWLGQDIVEGDVVYRGAREGDSSSFRIGIVDLIRDEKRTARVIWHWVGSSTGVWNRNLFQGHYDDPKRYTVPGPHAYRGSKGTSSIDTLVKMDPAMLKSVTKRAAMIEAARDCGILEEDFERFAEDYMNNALPL